MQFAAAVAAVLLVVFAVSTLEYVQHQSLNGSPGQTAPTVADQGTRTAPVSTSGYLIYLVSPDVGWRVAEASLGQNARLYKTSDGGLHWRQQLTWLGPSPSAATFVSPTEGVIAIPMAESWLIYSTTDGENWRRAEAKIPTTPLPSPGRGPGPRDPGSVSFINAHEGWQRFDTRDGVAIISHTNDAGRSWQEVGRLQSPSPASSQITFITRHDGFIGGSYGRDGASPPISVTHDGGKSWSVTNLPTLPGVSADNPVHTNEFRAGGGSSVFLRVGVVLGSSGSKQFLYSSGDAGRTWSNPIEIRVPALHLQALDSRRLVSALGQSTFTTGDGGRTWIEHKGAFPPLPPAEGNYAYGPYWLAGIVFVNDEVGWAVATSMQQCRWMEQVNVDLNLPLCPPGGPKTVKATLKTVDAGASWTLVRTP
jgi:photosystem II stability/assembly factor-like uncharacterized protein